jgi:archaellum component FlaC
MSTEYQTIIDGLKSKIEIIISKYEQVAAENRKLSQELGICIAEQEQNINKIKELEEKVNKLQLAEAFKSSSQDVKEAKHKIGKIVKEIDKCIALLND